MTPSKPCAACGKEIFQKGNLAAAWRKRITCSYTCSNVYKWRHRAKGAEEALAKFSRVVPSGCILWVGGKRGRMGYGHITWRGRSYAAHRLAYEAFVGPIPIKIHVLHKCDTPACVNPDHLFLGTHDDNMADKKNKGRASKRCGEDAPYVKLNKEAVSAIKSSPAKGVELAKIYSVSSATISLIRAGKLWKEVNLI